MSSKKKPLRRISGTPCPYCGRTMNKESFQLYPTWDHHPIPKSKGGTKKIVCCMLCNNRKGAMTPEQWDAYMKSHPQWWLWTKETIRARRTRNREIIRTIKWGERGSLFAKRVDKNNGTL